MLRQLKFRFKMWRIGKRLDSAVSIAQVRACINDLGFGVVDVLTDAQLEQSVEAIAQAANRTGLTTQEAGEFFGRVRRTSRMADLRIFPPTHYADLNAVAAGDVCGSCSHFFHGMAYDYAPGPDGEVKIADDHSCGYCSCVGRQPEGYVQDGNEVRYVGR